MTTPELFSRPIRVADVSRAGRTVAIEASEDERRRVAEAFGLLELGSFTADLHVVLDRRAGLRVTGTLGADVVQRCVVSLEPVPARVSERFDARFAPEDVARRADDEIEVAFDEEDPPEPIVAGVADIGPLLLEYLALGLDPYPRAPGAAFENGEPNSLDQTAPAKPFAALAALKKPT